MSKPYQSRSRIEKELVAAGMTKYGLLKGETHHLPKIIHPQEHIGGVIYGRGENGSRMLVATDKRMIYLDHKFLFNKADEISYEVLAGVSHQYQGRFATVVVHTRVQDFTIRFVNRKCAAVFVEYIEGRQIEKKNGVSKSNNKPLGIDRPAEITMNQTTRLFLMSHDVGTLSTVDGKGWVSGAAVHYVLGDDSSIYIVTKSDTRKIKNIASNRRVALTVYDIGSMQTVQIQATADIEDRPRETEIVLSMIIKPRLYGKDTSWPPITTMVAGNYVIIRLMPTDIRFYDYKH